MAKNKEYELAIKIAGEIEKSFYNSTKLTKKELQEIAKQASQTSSSVSETFSKGLKDAAPAFDGIASAGTAAFEAVATAATIAATAVAATIAASISVGSSFESAFAGVRKTTEATEAEYEKLRQGILAMSEELPASADAIAEVAEAAGQLGIQKENLLDFTRVMIDLGESTNMESTEAASALAKFANITNMAATEYSNLGSVIVALGNNFATTESDIVAMATRLAASGELVGLSQSQIMGIATAMSSVGIEAEAGGSAMSKLLKNVQIAVELGGESLEQYASVAGMTTAEFQKSFEEDALSAVNAFIAGLNDTERNGKSAIAILDDMGLTEVRLSNTILSLANANGVLTDAVTLANSAWEENVALTNEAAQRYATTESKAEMLKNKIVGIGIEIYDELREPYRAVLDLASDTVSELGDMMGESNVISNMASSFSKNLPTAVRRMKEFGSAVANFAKPFLEVGGWLIDNPGLIVGTIAGIGTAIATYKVASGIMSIVTALGSLGPVGWSIMAIGAVVGVIAGIGTAVKKSAQEAKKANLAAHFGNIALSLEELEEVAGFIVSNDSLGQLREAISAFEGLEEIQRALDDSISTINKMNWKVSIGMELTPDEQEQYQSEIAEYATRCQQYVQDKQYAINLAVGILTDDDLEGNSITTQINDFYASKQQELADLGTKLNETITEAFQDGLLDMDEVAEITQLQEQMARIQSAIAGRNFDENLNLLELKYNGGALDAETFQNLQAEIQEQMDLAIADYDEAYTLSVANAKIMLDDGAINASEYQRMVEEFKENYLEQIGELEAKSLSFQLNTITQAYSDEIGVFNEHMSEVMQEYTDETYMVDWEMRPVIMWDAMAQEIWNSDIDKTTKEAIAELLETMEPSLEQIEELKAQYKELGMELPAELEQAIMDADTLGAMTVYQKVWGQAGDMQALYDAMSQQLVNDPGHAEIVEMLKGYGWELPEAYAQAVSENKEVMETASSDLYDTTRMYLYNNFLPGFDVETDVRIQMNPIYDSNGNLTGPYSNEYIQQFGKAPFAAHAEGGIFSTPHYGVFAEDGMEAFIPIDGSQRAMDLWEQTGQLLGVNGIGEQEDSFSGLSRRIMDESATSQDAQTGGQSGSITYAPTLQFYGDAPDRKELDEALALSQEKFEEMMEKYISNNRRLNFAWEG